MTVPATIGWPAVFFVSCLGAAAPARWPLAGNKLALDPPAGFELMSSQPDGSHLTLRTPGGATLVSLDVTRAPQPASDANRKKLGEALLAKLRKESKAMLAETLAPAAVVGDDTVFVKIIDTIRVDGRVSSRCRAVRIVGPYAVEMYAIATDPNDGKREGLLTAAQERVLLRIEPAAADVTRENLLVKADLRTLPKAHLAFTTPENWDVRMNDVAEGVVATFSVALGPGLKLTLTAIPLKEPELADELLTATIEKLAGLEEEALQLPQPLSDPQRVQDGRFLQRTRRTAGTDAAKRISDSRVRRVGTVLVSVAMTAPPDQEETAAKAADQLALSIVPR